MCQNILIFNWIITNFYQNYLIRLKWPEKGWYAVKQNNQPIYMCVYMCVCVNYPQILLDNTSCALNSEFSFSKIGCHTKATKTSLSSSLTIAERERDVFIPFQRIIVKKNKKKKKQKQPRTRFELIILGPFPMMITVTLSVHLTSCWVIPLLFPPSFSLSLSFYLSLSGQREV